MKSVRLDRYYSFPSYVDKFGDTKVYIILRKNVTLHGSWILRKNVTLHGSWKWKDTMKEFVKNTSAYLGQYYLRNNSESGFSADRRRFGWKIMQKREDKTNTAITCTNIWHNLLNLCTT